MKEHYAFFHRLEKLKKGMVAGLAILAFGTSAMGQANAIESISPEFVNDDMEVTSAASAPCSITNNQAGIASGTLQLFRTPGNAMYTYFNPEGSGGAGDPGCGIIDAYPFTIESVDLNMADPSLFGTNTGVGTYQYVIKIYDAVSTDDCSEVGDFLFESEVQTEEMDDTGFHPATVSMGVEVSGPFFVSVETVSWDGAETDSAPSVLLWDATANLPCRTYVQTVVDDVTTITDFQDYFTNGLTGWTNIVVNGQTAEVSEDCIAEDNMDDYISGDPVGPQSDNWSTWSGTEGGTEDAMVSSDQALSGNNSVVFELATTDVVYNVGNHTEGTYQMDLNLYVPSGNGAYWNIQKDVIPGEEWGIEIYHNPDGTGSINAGGTGTATFNYPQDEWILASTMINLDDDIATFSINGEEIHTWAYSTGATGEVGGLLQIGGFNFYPAGVENALFYVDDISFCAVESQVDECIAEDNIDSYTSGEAVGPQSDNWSTWSGTEGGTEDAMVSSDQALSGTNSVVFDQATTDVIYTFGNHTEGAYEATLHLYIPSGNGAYWNIQKDVTAGVEWGLEVSHNGDGTGSINAGGTDAATFTYPQDEWFSATTIINLSIDQATFYINDEFVHSWAYSTGANGAAGILQVGGFNFYPAGADNSLYYVDDISFCAISDCIVNENLDAYNADEAVGPQSDNWTTWSGTEGGTEDAMVSSAQALSGTNSVVFEAATTDVLYTFGNHTSGTYEASLNLYIPSGNGAYWNIQKDVTAGVEWAIEVLHNGDGTGSINAGGTNTATFTYPQDQWFTASTIVSLDDDIANFYVDGALVHQWVYSTGATGTGSLSQIGAFNFYPAGADNPLYYVDDISFCPSSLEFVANDLCATATDLNDLTGGVFNVVETSSQFTNIGAAGLNDIVPDCFDDGAATVTTWYTFTGDGNVYFIETDDCGGSATEYANDTQMAIFTGTCNNLTQVACAEDIDFNNDIWEAGLSFTTTEGVEYLIMVDTWGGAQGNFCISFTNQTNIGIEENAVVGLELYPNPASDQFVISADVNITNISIYNTIGQLISNIPANTTQEVVDVSELQNGVYIVNVTIEGKTYVQKFVKQ